MRSSVGSPNGRPRKSMPTGSFAGTASTMRVPSRGLPPPALSAEGGGGGTEGSRTQSYTLVVKPAGTVIAGNPCWPRNVQTTPRPFKFGGFGPSNGGGGRLLVG